MARGRTRLDRLESIYRQHFTELVRSLALVEGPEAAADAVQDAFAQAHRHWRRIERYEDPAAWVRRVALNRLLNRRRLARRKPLVFDLQNADESPNTTNEPEQIEQRVDIVAAMADLTARQRACLSLYYFGDFPVSAVAQAMGVSEGTVKAVLHQARQRMAPVLGGEQ